MADNSNRVPVALLNEENAVPKFNKRVAEAFGSMQIIAGASFIGLSLAAMYWGYTIGSQMSTWFSIFWILGGTTYIMAGYSKQITVIRSTLLFSIISLISTVVLIVIISYAFDRFNYMPDRQVGIYSGMLAALAIEFVFAIMTIVHCSMALCSSYPKKAQVQPMPMGAAPEVPMVYVQQMPLVGMTTGQPHFQHRQNQPGTPQSQHRQHQHDERHERNV